VRLSLWRSAPLHKRLLQMAARPAGKVHGASTQWKLHAKMPYRAIGRRTARATRRG
jgi:hypothetical protein